MTPFQRKIYYGSLEFVFTLQERYFQGHQLSAFFHASDNSDSVVFVNAAFGEIRDHSLRTTLSQKKVCYGSFEFVFTLRKKVFSEAPVKCVFLYGSTVFLGDCHFWRDQRSQFENDIFSKKNLI